MAKPTHSWSEIKNIRPENVIPRYTVAGKRESDRSYIDRTRGIILSRREGERLLARGKTREHVARDTSAILKHAVQSGQLTQAGSRYIDTATGNTITKQQAVTIARNVPILPTGRNTQEEPPGKALTPYLNEPEYQILYRAYNAVHGRVPASEREQDLLPLFRMIEQYHTGKLSFQQQEYYVAAIDRILIALGMDNEKDYEAAFGNLS